MESFAQLRICCASAGRLSNIVRCPKEKSLTDHLCLRNGLPPTCYKGFQRAVHDMNVSWAIVLVGVLLATVVANEPRKTLTLDSRKPKIKNKLHHTIAPFGSSSCLYGGSLDKIRGASNGTGLCIKVEVIWLFHLASFNQLGDDTYHKLEKEL